MLQARRHYKPIALALLLLAVLVVVLPPLLLFPTYSPEMTTLTLPEPDVIGSMPLSTAMRDSGYSSVLSDHQMRIDEVSQLLWAVQGITHGSVFRAVPSAGATYPLELFFVQMDESELEEGYYHYIPQEHQLEWVNTTVDRGVVLSAFMGDDRTAVSSVSTVYFILANYSRTTARYGDRGIQYVNLETGHAVQNFLLQLSSLGLKTRPITQFGKVWIQNLLSTSFVPLVALPVGLGNDGASVPQARVHFCCAEENEATVEQAIMKRRSTRDYINGTIPFTVIADILNDSSSIEYLDTDSSILDVRVVAGQVDGLGPGSYNYWLVNGSFTELSTLDLRGDLMTAGLSQPWIEDAQLDLVISVDMGWVNAEPDSSYAHRVAMISIGMMAQNICLKGAAYGLGTVTVGAFYEDQVATVVDLPGGFKPIYIMPIGLTSEFVG
ncbi:MAG: SagB family peptide dehydrogenase [Candidatus Thorarchaeota archaeon]|nr:MAG: SagB family peptide dehydrogenase [Candidatus Thorarchaeota archaeon]